jgi:hypothetical protein
LDKERMKLMMFDKILLSTSFIMISIIVFLYHRSTKEDSIFWYGKWRDFVFWERAQKHPEENKDN